MGKDKKNKGNSELNTPMAVNNALAGADLDSKPKANDKNKKNTPKKNGKNAPNKERVGFFKKLKNTFKERQVAGRKDRRNLYVHSSRSSIHLLRGTYGNRQRFARAL